MNTDLSLAMAVEAEADTSALTATQRQVEALERTTDRFNQSTDSASVAGARLNGQCATLTATNRGYDQQLTRTTATTQAFGQHTTTLVGTTRSYDQQLTRASATTQAHGQRTAALASTTRGYDQQLTRTAASTQSFSQRTAVAAERSGNLGAQIRGATAAAVALATALGAVGAGTKLVDQLRQYQDVRTQVVQLTGSAEAWGEVEQYLIGLAAEHNANLLVLAGSYSKIMALEKAGIVTRSQGRDILEGMSNAGKALGASNVQLEQSLYGLSQALGTGTLRAEELNQTTEPLPGFLQAIAAAADMTAGQFREMATTGQVSSEMFRDYVIEALQDYEGAAASTADNLSAKFSQLETSWTLLAKALEDEVDGTAGEVLEGLASTLNWLSENADGVLNVVGALAVVLGARLAAGAITATAAKVKLITTTRAQIISERQAAIVAQESAALRLSQATQELALAKVRKMSMAGVVSATQAVTAAEARVTAARAANIQATTALTAAQASYTASATAAGVATTGLRSSMALIGGPTGVALVAAAGFALLAKRMLETSEASTKVLDALKEVRQVASGEADIGDMSNDRLQAMSDNLQQKIDLQLEAIAQHESNLAWHQDAIERAESRGNGGFLGYVFGGASADDLKAELSNGLEAMALMQSELKLLEERKAEIEANLNKPDDSATAVTTTAEAAALAKLQESYASRIDLVQKKRQEELAVIDAAESKSFDATVNYAALRNQVNQAAEAELSKIREDAAKERNRIQEQELRDRQATELAAAAGFANVAEQAEAAFQQKLEQTRLRYIQSALDAEYEARELALLGYQSQEERMQAEHEERLAKLEKDTALNAIRDEWQTKLLLLQGYLDEESKMRQDYQRQADQIVYAQALLAAEGYQNEAEKAAAEHERRLQEIKTRGAGEYQALMLAFANVIDDFKRAAQGGFAETARYVLDVASLIADQIGNMTSQWAALQQQKLNNVSSDYNDTVATMQDQYAESETALVNQYNAGLISQEQYEQGLAGLEQAQAAHHQRIYGQYAAAYAEQEEAARSAFEMNKLAQAGGAVIDGARAIMAAWAMGPYVGAAMSPIIAGVTALQVATIANQKFQSGGLSKPPVPSVSVQKETAKNVSVNPMQSAQIMGQRGNSGITFDLRGLTIEPGADLSQLTNALGELTRTHIAPALKEYTAQGGTLFDEYSDQAQVTRWV